MNLCSEIAIARKEAGLSQEALANRLSVVRERIARLEAGTGSVELLVRVMSEIPMRLNGVAKGYTIIEQIKNSRTKRRWTVQRLATKSGLDARTVQSVEAGHGTVASLCSMLSALAPKAARQAQVRQFWDYNRAKTSEADSRFTPTAFANSLTEAFGEIALDPCSHHLSSVRADRKIELPECGLAADWASPGFVYVNAPFSDLAVWLKKANDEWEAGKIGKLAFLMPGARLDIGEFHNRAVRHATTLVLRDRLRFGYPEQPHGKYRAPFALCLALWGCTDAQIDTFRTKWPSLVLPPQAPSKRA